MKKRINWILTGGTFSCQPFKNGLAPHTTESHAKAVLSSFPDLAEEYDIFPITLLDKDSTDINADDWEKIAAAVNNAVKCSDGVVITHGTDTMAYTAAVLSVMLENPPVPIILTGSQLPFFAENSDAPRNFLDSFTAAADSRIKGVAVVFCGKIFDGLDVYKADSVNFDAFAAYNAHLGYVNEKSVTLLGERSNGGEYRYNPVLKRDVALVTVTPVSDSGIISYLVNSGVKGIVVKAYGLGGIPHILLSEIKKATERGVKITLVSQCIKGGVDLDVYEVGSAAKDAGITVSKHYGAEAALAEMMLSI